MARGFLALAITALIFSAESFADLMDTHILKREWHLFENKDCNTTRSCTLKSIRYLAEDYRIEMLDGFNFGTRFFSEYKTKTVDALEEYTYVNYIRGCKFQSTVNNGTYVVDFYANSGGVNSQTVNYADWIIDSPVDNDPAYNSYPGLSRHYSYRWNSLSEPFDRKSDKYFGKEKPAVPKLHITDIPGSAWVDQFGAKNISIEFKTCLYRDSEVPATIPSDGKIAAEPIHCYRWASSWIYDHAKKEFTNPHGISDSCK